MNKLLSIVLLVIVLLLIAITIEPSLSKSYSNDDRVVEQHKLMLKYGNK